MQNMVTRTRTEIAMSVELLFVKALSVEGACVRPVCVLEVVWTGVELEEVDSEAEVDPDSSDEVSASVNGIALVSTCLMLTDVDFLVT